MKILAIETSCDETAAAVVEGRRVLSSVVYSQILIHRKWGGVVPSLAKRAHEQRIDLVIEEALRKFYFNNKSLFGSELSSGVSRYLIGRSPSSLGLRGAKVRSLAQTSTSLTNFVASAMKKINIVAVTYGPGLAIALEVGIEKAKELAEKYDKRLIAVDHMEGHIYSCFAQNSQGNPKKDLTFPYLAFLVSGGHTELVLMKNHLDYQILGATLDDAAGEALDKAAKMLGLGYPGGPVLERLARAVDNTDEYKFPRPMVHHKDLRFSFSGLKTAFLYFLRKMSDAQKAKKLSLLASSFQEAVVDTLCIRLDRAIVQTGVNRVVVGGGVSANQHMRKRFRQIVKKHAGSVTFPPYKYLTGDNAAMIGVAAAYHAEKGDFVKDFAKLDRVPRLKLGLLESDNY